MPENEQRKEISLLEILRILLSKFYILLIALIVGAVAGGTFAYFKYHDIKYYGSTMDFVVSINSFAEDDTPMPNPNYTYKEEHLSSMVHRLSSDVFTKKIMEELRNDSRIYGSVPQTDPTAEDYSVTKFYSFLRTLQGCISYSYNYKRDTNAISVNVSVLNNEKFAEILLDVVHDKVVEEVKQYMIRPSDYTDNVSHLQVHYTTNCEELSISTVSLLNGRNTVKKVTLFSLIGGIALLFLACVIIIAIDNADTRLRDYDYFAESINVHVLGVIPSIETFDRSAKRRSSDE